MRLLTYLQQKLLERNSSACSSLGYASLRRHVLILTESVHIPFAAQYRPRLPVATPPRVAPHRSRSLKALQPVPAVTFIAVAANLWACVESIDAPAPTEQAQVAIPERLYLRARSDSELCSRIYNLENPPSPVDGGAAGSPQANIAYNCFVYLQTSATNPVTLPVDIHEVTNLQYQLCYDSEACSGPNPADASKGSVCESESAFDGCPVVGVTYQQAQDYCEWVGRRLPTNLEQNLIRQSALDTNSNNLPLRIPQLPTGDTIPDTCSDGVIANGGCSRPYPVMSGDVLASNPPRLTGDLYDLVGNVSELVADLHPDRAAETDLPWFCSEALPNNNSRTCPDGKLCVYGSIINNAGNRIADRPVCIARSQDTDRPLQTAGFHPIIVGASYADTLRRDPVDDEINNIFNARSLAGVFGRRVLRNEAADRFATTQTGQKIGFRCVGQRTEPGAAFDDTLLIQNAP